MPIISTPTVSVASRLLRCAATLPLICLGAPAAAGPADARVVVDISDLDLSDRKERLARDFRVGSAAATSCLSGANQTATTHRACVEDALRQAHRCVNATVSCAVAIDQYARPQPRPRRPSFGPRSF